MEQATMMVMLDRPKGAHEQPFIEKGAEFDPKTIASEDRLKALRKGGSIVTSEVYAALRRDQDFKQKAGTLIATPKSDRKEEDFDDVDKKDEKVEKPSRGSSRKRA